jgi:Spy/CpxP family protein refolding chaperone
MIKKAWIIPMIMMAGASLLLTAQPAFQGPASGHGRRGEGFFARQDFLPPRLLLQAKEEIGLNADQEKKIGAMIEAHEQWAVKFEADMKLQALKLRKVLTADKIEMKEAEKLIREQAAMHADMQVAGLRLYQDIRALLTPEQIAKMAELKKKLRDRPRDGMGPRNHMGARGDRGRGRRN